MVMARVMDAALGPRMSPPQLHYSPGGDSRTATRLGHGRHGGLCPCPAARPQIWVRPRISRIFPPAAGEAAVAARRDPGRKRQPCVTGGSRAKEATLTTNRPNKLGGSGPTARTIDAGLRRACRLSEAGVVVSRSCAFTSRHLRNGGQGCSPTQR